MDNAGSPQAPDELQISSENLSEFSTAPIDDIPEAVRENPEAKARSRSSRRPPLWVWGGLGGVALLLVPFLVWQSQSFPPSAPQSSEPSTSPTIAATTDPSGVTTGSQATDTLLGHLPYEEAPEAELVSASDDGSILLRQAAAEQFVAMVDAARAEGIKLMPLSGFRSVDQQDDIFFEVKAERGQQATTRAEVSAPPGYSEHHTGYAVDMGDAYYPDTDLQVDFEDTPAFKWLQENAAYYSFELSFPEGNAQGVSYEPWHWRFVGDRDSLETFYQARSGRSSPSSSEAIDADKIDENGDNEDNETVDREPIENETTDNETTDNAVTDPGTSNSANE